MSIFRAYRLFDEGGRSQGRFVELSLADLDPGEVLIRVHYSGVNYKDALAATGAGKVVRRFPCVGGVDAAGKVEHSTDARFRAGDSVLVTGYGMGVDHDGGYAEYLRVPAAWVVPLPQGLSLFDAMVLGTAGFTAALAIHRLEQNELTPDKGKVIVTGASGGVGSLAVSMLAGLGYQVVALTGKAHEAEYLRSLGASEVLLRDEVDFCSGRALEKGLWAGALDGVGGEVLSWLMRTMRQDGAIGSYGNAGGVELNASVFPFILRGVKLLGVDSAATEMTLRRTLWRRLANELRPATLRQIAKTVPFSELEGVFPELLQGRLRGRTVIDFMPVE